MREAPFHNHLQGLPQSLCGQPACAGREQDFSPAS